MSRVAVDNSDSLHQLVWSMSSSASIMSNWPVMCTLLLQGAVLAAAVQPHLLPLRHLPAQGSPPVALEGVVSSPVLGGGEGKCRREV
jgi:hypothetical protein